MKSPHLIVFDIDATLLKPAVYHNTEEVRKGLYDVNLLTTFLVSSDYQVAIASYNRDVYPKTGPIGGRRLGRLILDLQDPVGDSHISVEDDFIQAWQYKTYEDMEKFGKNKHLQIIIDAYKKKYNIYPKEISFFDDLIHNVYLANKIGVYGYWVTNGLTKNTISSYIRIGLQVFFKVSDENAFIHFIKNNSGNFSQLIRKKYYQQSPNPIYRLYLPADYNLAKKMYKSFIRKSCEHKIQLGILSSEINNIV